MNNIASASEYFFFNKRNDELLRIYDHFGYKNQLEKLAEEIKEFSDAYAEWVINGFAPEFWDHMIEEFADVDILISQFRKNIIRVDEKDIFHLDLGDAEENKIQRTLKRIEEGYYEQKT